MYLVCLFDRLIDYLLPACRHEMFPMYKAQRAPTPPAVTEGARQVRDLIRVMGIPEIIIPGVEADDAIGTLAMRGIREGFQVAIASPDKVSKKEKKNTTPLGVKLKSQFNEKPSLMLSCTDKVNAAVKTGWKSSSV